MEKNLTEEQLQNDLFDAKLQTSLDKFEIAIDHFAGKMQTKIQEITEDAKNQPETSHIVKMLTLNFQSLNLSIVQLKKHIHTNEGKLEQIKIIREQVETLEVSFELYRNEIEVLKIKYDELKNLQIKDKKDTDKKLDDIQQDVKNLFTQNNNLHTQVNLVQRDIQDIRFDIRLLNQKLDLINSDTRNAGAAYANTFIEKIKSATNVPSHTPEQLKTILELIGEYRDKTDKNEKDPTKKTVTRKKWQDMIIKAAQEGLLSMAQAGIDATLTMRDCRIKYDELVQDSEGKIQASQFLESFATGLANEIITIHPSAETVKLALDAIKVAFALGKFVYKLHKANQIRKEVEAYWENEVEESMDEMISMLKVSTKETFEMMVQLYISDQCVYYGRNDVEFKKGWGLRGYNVAPKYTRTFSTIPDYHETVPEYTDISRAIQVVNFNLNLPRFDVRIHLKEEFNDERYVRQFIHMLKGYLAVRELGEFRKNLSGIYPILSAGDDHIDGLPRKLANGSSKERNMALVPMITMTVYTGAIPYAIAEGVKKRIYYNNTPRLTEYMRKLLIAYSSEACNLIIEQLVALTKLRIYNEATGCEFGNFCYKLLVDGILAGKIRGKNDEAKLTNKEIFIEAFYLLEKMNNLGVANRDIFFDTRIQTSVASNSMSDICSDISDRLTGMYQEALSRNPNPLNVVVHTRPKNQFTFTDQKQKREISK